MNKAGILERIHREWLVLILRGDTAQQTEDTFEALIEGGATLIEVPFTTPDASKVIANLRHRHGDRIVVSAGTVTTVEQARTAIESGAQGIVSPNLFARIVEYAVERGVVSAPGCFTPSEIGEALRLGADVIKLFPCDMLGPRFLWFMQGPFPGVRIMPAGSITLDNMDSYFEAGAFAGVAGVTTEMQLLDAVQAGTVRRDHGMCAPLGGRRESDGRAGSPEMSAGTDFRTLPISEMEAVIARFEERVSAAQQASAATKPWVKQAVRRRGLGRCPVRLKRLSLDVILRYGDALADMFCEFPDDVIAIIPYDITIGHQPPEKSPRINVVEALMRDAQWTDEWGTRWGHAFGGVGATPIDPPIKDWLMLDEYLADRIPNPRAPGRFAAALPVLEMHGAAKYCYGVIHLALFERLHALRGMQALFTDFYTNETGVHRLMDALQTYLLEIVRAWAQMGADAVFLTDDWGSQTGLLINPELWRRFFKPYYAEVFGEAHRLGMDVIFHSCGNVMAIVGDLVDIGLDVLDPIQPGAMDIDALAREFGGQLSFSGAVDVQDLLCSGSLQQVKNEVHRAIDTLGRPFGGGLILGPANIITPETPLENLCALFAAAHTLE